MNKRANKPTDNSKPSPADYPIGSLESRAAARALIKDKEGKFIQIVYVSTDGTEENGPLIKIGG
jgi:hypothetical protein